jgi:hypothetical protein
MSLTLVVYISEIGSDDQSRYNVFKYNLERRVYKGGEKPGFLDRYPYVRLDELVETKKRKFLSAYLVDEANADDLVQYLKKEGEAKVAEIDGISFNSIPNEARREAILRWFKKFPVQSILGEQIVLSDALDELAKEALRKLNLEDEKKLKDKIIEIMKLVKTIRTSDNQWTGGEIAEEEIDADKRLKLISEWLSQHE